MVESERKPHGRQIPSEPRQQTVVAPAATELGSQKAAINFEDNSGIVVQPPDFGQIESQKIRELQSIHDRVYLQQFQQRLARARVVDSRQGAVEYFAPSRKIRELLQEFPLVVTKADVGDFFFQPGAILVIDCFTQRACSFMRETQALNDPVEEAHVAQNDLEVVHSEVQQAIYRQEHHLDI